LKVLGRGVDKVAGQASLLSWMFHYLTVLAFTGTGFSGGQVGKFPDNVIQFPGQKERERRLKIKRGELPKQEEVSSRVRIGTDKCGDTIRVEMDDGSQWDVNLAHVVAIYADMMTGDGPDAVYENNATKAMSDIQVLIEWAEQELSWKDLMSHAKLHKLPNTCDYNNSWKHGMKDVIRQSDT
jgi:hypothetical protein